MRNGKVKLDSECGPCSAIADPGFLDGRIGIEHRLPADFVDARIDMPAQIRQDRTLQVFVFKIDRAPAVSCTLVADFFPQGIGIIESTGRELVEGRIWIRRSFCVCRKIQSTFPDVYLSPNGYGANTQE